MLSSRCGRAGSVLVVGLGVLMCSAEGGVGLMTFDCLRLGLTLRCYSSAPRLRLPGN